MGKSRGYKIEWNRNTMIMSKGFADKARQIGSQEYEDLMKMRANGFHVVEKYYKPRKACPTRVTYKKMKNYFNTLSTKDEELKKFNAARNESKGYHNPYEYVRQWFIREYPGYFAAKDRNSKKKNTETNLHVVPDENAAERKLA